MAGFAGLPPFLFAAGAWVDQLVCDVRTFVRANDGSRDLYAPMLAWSAGPVAVGVTGDNSPASLVGATWLLQVCPDGSWMLYREERGLLTVIPWDDPPEMASGTARHVSLAFDQSARVVLTWEDEGVIKVRRWDPVENEYIENVTFSGVDPVVVFDATWRYRVPDSDVLIFYLSSDRERLCCRVQRDVYGTEYEVWDFETPVILDRVVALPYKYQVLVADSTGSPLPDMLISALYPVALTVGVGLSAEFVDGEYRQTAWSYAPSLGVELSAEFVGGALTLPVTTYSPTVGVELSPGFVSGAYFSPVVTDEPLVGVELHAEFASGVLDEIGVRVAPTLGVELTAEFIGGTYGPG